MMKITVLGSGCSNCKRLLESVTLAVKELKLNVEIVYQTDMIEIAKTGIMHTPGLMIDEKIVSSGKVLTKDQVILLLKNIE